MGIQPKVLANPGAGRAKLRLSRGFPVDLAEQHHPHNSRTAIDHDHLMAPNKVLNLRATHFLSDDANDSANRGRRERMIKGGDVAGECDAGSPGSGGAFNTHLPHAVMTFNAFGRTSKRTGVVPIGWPSTWTDKRCLEEISTCLALNISIFGL
jgi:hypothetical protein